jgi:hypothetical protein
MANRVIYRVDIRSDKVDATWAIPDREARHGLASGIATHRLFPSCIDQKLVFVNTDTGASITTLTIGRGSDSAAFHAKRKQDAPAMAACKAGSDAKIEERDT